jgi:hypothetical protein
VALYCVAQLECVDADMHSIEIGLAAL